MERENNPQRSVRFADVAPELRPCHNGPQGGPPASIATNCQYCDQLQYSLAEAHRQIASWNRWNESVQPILSSARVEKESFNRKVLYLKSEISKREADLATKQKEFAAERKKKKDIMCERGLQIFHLQTCLQNKKTEPNKYWKEEVMSITAKWEAEKETVSKLKQETLQEKMQIEEGWQKKVKMLQDQLSQKDAELLVLRKEKGDLSEKLTEKLVSKDNELLQTKCDLEKFKKELAEKEKIWKASMKMMEEEKKNLQDLCLKEKEDLSKRLKETSTLLVSQDNELLQTKCDLDKFKKQLAEKEKIWNSSMKMMEEEKKDLQDLCLKEKGGLCEKLTKISNMLVNKDTELGQTRCDLEKFKKELVEQKEIWKANVELMEEEKKNLQEHYLKENEDLSKTLTETSDLLRSKNTELLQSQKTWQTKCDGLTKELAESQKRWEARITEMEQEMKTLEELCLKKKKKRHFWSQKKKAKTETEKKEGFWSRKHKKCDNKSEVEEGAGCSGNTGQQ